MTWYWLAGLAVGWDGGDAITDAVGDGAAGSVGHTAAVRPSKAFLALTARRTDWKTEGKNVVYAAQCGGRGHLCLEVDSGTSCDADFSHVCVVIKLQRDADGFQGVPKELEGFPSRGVHYHINNVVPLAWWKKRCTDDEMQSFPLLSLCIKWDTIYI